MAANLTAVQEAYVELLRVARGCCRSVVEARDLVQDAFEAALARGFDDWDVPARRAWLRGVVRKRAAFLARGEARRRKREQLVEGEAPKVGAWRWEPGFLASLPPSVRRVATLMSADLTAAEIRWLLGLTDTALRQRLTVLRRAVREAPEMPAVSAPEPAFAPGARRSHWLAALRARPGGVLATHDPDGHGILLCGVAHKPGARGNTAGKEDPCPDPS